MKKLFEEKSGMSINEKVDNTIHMLLHSDINGCIAGSSMIGANFDEWDEAPDVDVFVYSEHWLTNAVTWLLDNGWTIYSPGDEWKYNRCLDRGMAYKQPVNTLKVIRDGLIVNVSYKKEKRKLADVLASFDMSIIMIGVDIRTGVVLDLRCGGGMSTMKPDLMVLPQASGVAVPNPLRKQDTDMYGTEMWVRQFNRVIKYWNRGYDTRPMARFYIKLIDETIDKGQLFSTQKSEAAFSEFKGMFEPLREQMVEWLRDKEEE